MIWVLFGGIVIALVFGLVTTAKTAGRLSEVSKRNSQIAKEAQEDEKIDAAGFVDCPATSMRRKNQ